MDTKELNKKIDALGKRNLAVESDIQALGLACMAHTQQHSDTMPMNRLVNVLRRGQHMAFVAWAITYGKFEKNTDKATMESQPLKFAKNKETDTEGAVDNPWHTFADSKETAIEKAFDLKAAVKALIKKAAGKVSKDELITLEKICVVSGVSSDGLIPKAHAEAAKPAAAKEAEPALV